nr:MAG TPA: hypothetical protein [Caudoviricetes sp.]
MKKLSRWLYYSLFPVYIPGNRRFSCKLHLAIWCCIDCRKSGNLWEVIKGTRITLRKDNHPVCVIKKGEI